MDFASQLGFTGNFEMSLDAKGRATVPSPFAKVLSTRYAPEGGALMLSISLERSIAVFPVEEWLKWMEEVESLPGLDAHSRSLRTVLNAYSYQGAIDSSNRVRLPTQLMELCGIEKEVAVIGQKSHFQIWDRGTWQAYSEKAIKTLAESAGKALAR